MISSKDSVIKAISLSKQFTDFWHRPKSLAVNEIDFDVKEGEIFGLLGPNGSGKSTTIKMILGLLYPSKGTVTVYNKSPRDVKIKSRLGYLPEESYLYKYLTASETLNFYGALFGLSASDRKRRAEQLLEMVGLSHVKNKPVGEFSKGMSRRIGLAQSMINDPDLLILDEPTSGLDPIACKEIKELIKFLKTRGKTVVISSHLLADVQDLCDRVIILYGGKIRGEGTLDELLTVSDTSRIIAPLLSEEISGKILDMIKESVGEKPVTVDHPKRSLEDYFLEVVNKAKNEKLATSGALSGGEIAEYLREGTLSLESQKILEELTHTEPPPAKKQENLQLDETKILSEKAQQKLAKLSSDENIPVIPGSEEDLEEANKKLSDILGKNSLNQ